MFDKQRRPPRLFALLCALALAACASASAPMAAPARGEAMVSAANPHAVDAALEILGAGGSAVDAAIAAEMVLGLVEPQASGIGGGGFMLTYDAASERIAGYDGRERAPMGARADMFLNANGQPMAFTDAQASGRSIGTPLLVSMLKLAHEDHGRLPWARLFEPAIQLAENGFAISPRMANYIALMGERGRLRADFAARAYFFDRAGAPLPAGRLLRNREYAQTLRAIAAQGPAALSSGPIADAIVAAAQRNPRGGALSLADLQSAQARRFAPLCGPYRAYRVCTGAPPSSGEAMLAILGLYERARPRPEGSGSADDWAAFLWASRLAYADRDHYIADPDFAPVPAAELIAPEYLDQRARMIDLARAPTFVPPGAPAGEAALERWGRDGGPESGTTHISIVDAWGDAVALTATIEAPFGAQRMVGGFLLNNQLTDFSFQPTLNGRPVANAAAPGKRPRTSMTPTIVTDRHGELVLVIGSPGGSSIIGYVARATIGMLDWGLSPQDAASLGNATARTENISAEPDRWPAGVAEALTARGWRIQPRGALEDSGIHAILATPQGLAGAADPRREGVVARVPAAAEAPPR